MSDSSGRAADDYVVRVLNELGTAFREAYAAELGKAPGELAVDDFRRVLEDGYGFTYKGEAIEIPPLVGRTSQG